MPVVITYRVQRNLRRHTENHGDGRISASGDRLEVKSAHWSLILREEITDLVLKVVLCRKGQLNRFFTVFQCVSVSY